MKEKVYVTLKWVCRTCLCIYLICLIYMIIMVVMPSLFGYTFTRHADTHSMEPAIDFTSYSLLDEDVPFDSIEVGDVISFYNPPALTATVDGVTTYGYSFGNDDPDMRICHRVISIETDNDGKKYFVTKGDNNPSQDFGRVYEEYYEGKFIWTARFLALPLLFFSVWHWDLIFPIIIFVCLVIMYIMDVDRTSDGLYRRYSKFMPWLK